MAKPDKATLQARKQERRERKEECTKRLMKLVPLASALSRKYGIEMIEIPNGYQFRVAEYILNWWLSTNKIVVQFVGIGGTHPYDATPVPGEPKIITALKKLIRVTKGADTSAT